MKKPSHLLRRLLPEASCVGALTLLILCGGCSDRSKRDSGQGAASGAVCGDGFVEGDEECDDRNTLDGDCCSVACHLDAAGTNCGDHLCSNGDAPGTCDGAGTCAADLAAPTGQCVVFLTSGSYEGNFGGLAGADAICQQLAEDEGLPGIFKAWLSDSQTSAVDRLSHSIVPYVRVDGNVVAESWDDLTDGSGLAHAISMSEGGYDWYNVCANCFWMPGGCGAVWTATAPNGGKERNTCGDWSSSEVTGGEGIYCLETGTSWTQWPDGTTSVDCWHARSFYCFQQ